MEKTIKKKKKNPKDFFRKNLKFMLLGIIALIIFHNYIVLITLIMLFALLGVLTMRVSMIVPHISIESITASAIFIGYVFDGRLGFIFGFLAGMVGYTMISQIKLKPLINMLLMGLCGLIASIFANLGYSFVWSYQLTFIIRIVLNNIIFPLVESDMFENMMHGYGDPLFNMLVTFQFMNLIYNVVVHFV